MSVNLSKLLVSSCLLGRPVRYDGSAKTLDDECIVRWIVEGRVISACPETMAGLPTPRAPAEISEGGEGSTVLSGDAKVIESHGGDATTTYITGAQLALNLAVATKCRYALLTDGSPSCGVSFVYDGSFTGQQKPGVGVTAALLRQHGIKVFSTAEMPQLIEVMDGLIDYAGRASSDNPSLSSIICAVGLT